jgi:hypothetical protein
MAPNKRSCNNQTINLNKPGSPKSKNVEKTLLNKYAKLIYFGFWILSKVSISDEDRNVVYEKLCMFANVELQTDFYDNFYEQEKEIAKSMRKFIAEKLKETRKMHAIKELILPKGRDQILRDMFIDNIMEIFNRD